MTEYYFWPRKDAWEELKVALEAKPWISARYAVSRLPSWISRMRIKCSLDLDVWPTLSGLNIAFQHLMNAMPCRDKILLLNRTTEVINFWQTEGQKPSLEQAAAAFPDCVFKGS